MYSRAVSPDGQVIDIFECNFCCGDRLAQGDSGKVDFSGASLYAGGDMRSASSGSMSIGCATPAVQLQGVDVSVN